MPPTEKKQTPEDDKRIDAHGSPLIKKGWSMFSFLKFKTLTFASVDTKSYERKSCLPDFVSDTGVFFV